MSAGEREPFFEDRRREFGAVAVADADVDASEFLELFNQRTDQGLAAAGIDGELAGVLLLRGARHRRRR